jgi:hypothetical protein
MADEKAGLYSIVAAIIAGLAVVAAAYINAHQQQNKAADTPYANVAPDYSSQPSKPDPSPELKSRPSDSQSNSTLKREEDAGRAANTTIKKAAEEPKASNTPVIPLPEKQTVLASVNLDRRWVGYFDSSRGDKIEEKISIHPTNPPSSNVMGVLNVSLSDRIGSGGCEVTYDLIVTQSAQPELLTFRGTQTDRKECNHGWNVPDVATGKIIAYDNFLRVRIDGNWGFFDMEGLWHHN